MALYFFEYEIIALHHFGENALNPEEIISSNYGVNAHSCAELIY